MNLVFFRHFAGHSKPTRKRHQAQLGVNGGLDSGETVPGPIIIYETYIL